MEREVQYLKEEASNAWRRGDFQVALDSYTQAIQIMLDHANEWYVHYTHPSPSSFSLYCSF